MSYIGNEPIVSATRTVTEIVATAGQTVFTANGGYTVGYIDVFINGAKLTNSDFTATNGTTITLTEAASVGDIVRLEALGTFLTSSGLTANNPNYTGTLTGGTGVVNIGSGQVYKDASGNVGIGTSSPAYKLSVNGRISYSGAIGEGADTTLSSTGTILQLGLSSTWTEQRIYTGGTERMRLDTSGNLLFNSGYGSVATAYGCRAWVNFNGTGTVAIRASGNVSSITDNGTGDYTINFTNAMPDANYAAIVTNNSDNPVSSRTHDSGTARTTTALRVQCLSSTFGVVDTNILSVSVFR